MFLLARAGHNLQAVAKDNVTQCMYCGETELLQREVLRDWYVIASVGRSRERIQPSEVTKTLTQQGNNFGLG